MIPHQIKAKGLRKLLNKADHSWHGSGTQTEQYINYNKKNAAMNDDDIGSFHKHLFELY